MKRRFEGPNGDDQHTHAIRSEIAHTRDEMGHTLEEISRCMTPRHLLDEFLDLLHSHGPSRQTVKDKAGIAARKAGDTASEIGQAVAGVVKEHPIPTLLIGAGVAWAFYERQRQESGPERKEQKAMKYGAGIQEETTALAEQAREESAEGRESTETTLKSAKEKAQEKIAGMREQVEEKTHAMRERARESTRRIREKASQTGQRVSESAQRAYETGRDRFMEAKESHPLTVGLGFLALGVLAGLALPKTRAEDEWIGQTAGRLKHRAKEQGRQMLERGRQVAASAAGAAREEAERQGLTPQGIKEQAKEVASEAGQAGKSTAEQQGIKTPEPAATGSGPKA